jgi:methylase of polypeptide subunit release factors
MVSDKRVCLAEIDAIVALGKLLERRGFRFAAVTPVTHCRVLERVSGPITLESIFGWNRAFERRDLDREFFDLLDAANAVEKQAGGYRSKIRFATIEEFLFAHSGFPTVEHDAVFFGPDTYRFVRLLLASAKHWEHRHAVKIVDVGSGSGAGGLILGRMLGSDTEIILADINPKALAFSAANAIINGARQVKCVASDVLAGIDGEPDIIIANPPYLIDDDRRLYRHGGGRFGISLARRIVEEGLPRLRPGGRLILYSGIPIINGTSPLLESLQDALKLYARDFVYEEIDPDVFGEELARTAYADADRIAAVGLTVIKRG